MSVTMVHSGRYIKLDKLAVLLFNLFGNDFECQVCEERFSKILSYANAKTICLVDSPWKIRDHNSAAFDDGT